MPHIKFIKKQFSLWLKILNFILNSLIVILHISVIYFNDLIRYISLLLIIKSSKTTFSIFHLLFVL